MEDGQNRAEAFSLGLSLEEGFAYPTNPIFSLLVSYPPWCYLDFSTKNQVFTEGKQRLAVFSPLEDSFVRFLSVKSENEPLAVFFFVLFFLFSSSSFLLSFFFSFLLLLLSLPLPLSPPLPLPSLLLLLLLLLSLSFFFSSFSSSFFFFFLILL